MQTNHQANASSKQIQAMEGDGEQGHDQTGSLYQAESESLHHRFGL